jgi:hypothetical protein
MRRIPSVLQNTCVSQNLPPATKISKCHEIVIQICIAHDSRGYFEWCIGRSSGRWHAKFHSWTPAAGPLALCLNALSRGRGQRSRLDIFDAAVFGVLAGTAVTSCSLSPCSWQLRRGSDCPAYPLPRRLRSSCCCNDFGVSAHQPPSSDPAALIGALSDMEAQATIYFHKWKYLALAYASGYGIDREHQKRRNCRELWSCLASLGTISGMSSGA